MAINDRTLSVDVWNEIRTCLVAAAPIITNTSVASTSTSYTTLASIRAAYNDRDSIRPQIVVSPITLTENQYKFGSTEGKKLINVSVDSYASNSLGTDQLYDQVVYAIKNYSFSNIYVIGITSDIAFDTANDAKFHMKSATITFDRE